MKKLFYIAFAYFALVTLQAQNIDESQAQNDKAKDKIKTARVGLITQKLNLTQEQAQKFWPLYNELSQKKEEARKPYQAAKKNVDPNSADAKQQQALVDLNLKVRQDELNLDKEYNEKFKSVITPQQILALHQAEQEFRGMLINHLQRRQAQRATPHEKGSNPPKN
jgi:Spy/CpxP family protein refolding chaperone